MKEIDIMRLHTGDRFQTTSGMNCYLIKKYNSCGYVTIGIRGVFISLTNEELKKMMEENNHNRHVSNFSFLIDKEISSFRKSFVEGEKNVKINDIYAVDTYVLDEYFTEELIEQELSNKQYILECSNIIWPDRVLLLQDGKRCFYNGESNIPLCVACICDMDSNTTVLVDDKF